MSLSNDDLQKISNLLVLTEERLEKKMEEKVAHLPSRDEFNEGIDKVYGLQKKNDEQILLLSGRVYRLEDEMSKIKDKIGLN